MLSAEKRTRQAKLRFSQVSAQAFGVPFLGTRKWRTGDFRTPTRENLGILRTPRGMRGSAKSPCNPSGFCNPQIIERLLFAIRTGGKNLGIGSGTNYRRWKCPSYWAKRTGTPKSAVSAGTQILSSTLRPDHPPVPPLPCDEWLGLQLEANLRELASARMARLEKLHPSLLPPGCTLQSLEFRIEFRLF